MTRVRTSKRRSLKDGIAPRDLRYLVLDRDRWRCQLCGVMLTDDDPTRPTHGHAGHVVAHADGGSLSLTNLRAECKRCSESDGARIGNRIRRDRRRAEKAAASTVDHDESADGTTYPASESADGTTDLGDDHHRDGVDHDESASDATDLGVDHGCGPTDSTGGPGVAHDTEAESNTRTTVFSTRRKADKAATFYPRSRGPTGPETGRAAPGFGSGHDHDHRAENDDDISGFEYETVTTPSDFEHCEWLVDLLDVPADATWPRFMSGPHPEAVGSYLTDAERIARDRGESELYWWQRLSLARILEHRDDGSPCWGTFIQTTARQVGKSVALRALCMWRLHQGPRVGEPQDVTLVSSRIRAADVIQRGPRMWAKATPGWSALNGAQDPSLTRLLDGSTWRMFSTTSIKSSSAGLAIVDEACDVDSAVVDDDLLPTMLARRWTQLGVVSTAATTPTSLLVDRRREILLGEDPDTLLVEWSAGADLDYRDPAAWRAASPKWTPGRESLIRSAARRAQRDADRLAGFEAELLNRWPLRIGDPIGGRITPGDLLIPPGVWDLLVGDEEVTGTLMFGLDSMTGETVTVAAAGATAGGLIQIEAYRVTDMESALTWVKSHAGPASILVIGATLRDDITEAMVGMRVRTAGARENTADLVMLRQLVRRRVVRHLPSEEMSTQLDHLRVSKGRTGIRPVDGPDTWDLVRPAAWAMAVAERDRAGTFDPSVW